MITTEPSEMVSVRSALQNAGIDYDSADVEFVSSLKVSVDNDSGPKVIKLIEALEDLDDVQTVFSNMEISDEVLAGLES